MGRHASANRGMVLRSLLVFLLVGVLAGTSIALVRSRQDPALAGPGDAPAGCGETVDVRVGADASVVPWLTTLAEAYTDLGREVAGKCATVDVRQLDARQIGQTVQQAESDPAAGIDVWVSESSTTINLARGMSRSPALAVPLTPIASSPIVLGMPRDAVQQATKMAGRSPRFGDLLTLARRPAGWGPLSTGQPEWGPIKFSTLDPSTNVVGAGFVVAAVGTLTGRAAKDVGATSFGLVDARAGLFAFVRTLVAAPKTGPALLDQAAATSSTKELLSKVGILAVAERDIWTYNGRQPTVRLQATYPLAGQLALDHPFALLNGSWVDGDKRAAAEDFRNWLLSDSAQQQLGGFGLRRADGTTGPELTEEGRGIDPQRFTPVAPASPDGPAAAMSAWQLITRPLSTLTLLDVSGSMAEKVGGSGTRLDLAKAAGITSIGFAEDRDSIGLWEFSRRLAGPRDYRELVPLGPANTRVGPYQDRRAAQIAAYRSLQPRTGTGLYDSILQAYVTANAAYRADAVNTVLLLSDGRNEDAGSANLARTLAALKARYKPNRPVHVVAIAYGPQADRAALAQIAKVTGGAMHIASDPRNVTNIFINAIVRLPAGLR